MLGGHGVFQPRHRHQRFDRRARRVLALQRAVEQRLGGVVVERLVGLEADAIDEQVRVESWLGHQRQHFATARLDRDDGTFAVAQCRLGGHLQLRVHGQIKALARRPAIVVEITQRPAGGVGFDDFRADLAVQVHFVAPFHTVLADMRGPTIALGAEFPQFLLRDAADVADHVGRRLTERIAPRQSRADIDAGEVVAVDLEAGHFVHRQARADRYSAIARRAPKPVAKAFHILVVEADDARQTLECVVDVLHLFGDQFEYERRYVVGQHRAIAVEDQAAHRRHHHQPHAIFVGARQKIGMLEHLQADQTRHQDGDGDAAGDQRHQRAHEEGLPLGVQILDCVVVTHL